MALCVNARPRGTSPGAQWIPKGRYGAVKSGNASLGPKEPRGTLRGGKMEELRIASGILGIRGPVFGFPCVATPPKEVARIYRFRVGWWALMSTPRGMFPVTKRN